MQGFKSFVIGLCKNAPIVLGGSAVIILATVYSMQYLGDFEPCKLCYAQRYPYFIILVLSLLSFLTHGKIRTIILLLIFLSLLTTISYAIYHVGVEQKWFESSCSSSLKISSSLEDLLAKIDSAPRVPCDESNLSIIGLSLAAWNAIISTLLALYTLFCVIRLLVPVNKWS